MRTASARLGETQLDAVVLGWIVTRGQHRSRGRKPSRSEIHLVGRTQAQVDNIEAGWRGTRETVSWQLAAYYMQKENIIFQDAERRNVSDARSEHRGIEYSSLHHCWS